MSTIQNDPQNHRCNKSNQCSAINGIVFQKWCAIQYFNYIVFVAAPYGWLQRLCKYSQQQLPENHNAASPICLPLLPCFLLAVKWSKEHCNLFKCRKILRSAIHVTACKWHWRSYLADVSTANEIGTLVTAPFCVVSIIMEIGQMCNCNIIGWILEIIFLRFLIQRKRKHNFNSFHVEIEEREIILFAVQLTCSTGGPVSIVKSRIIFSVSLLHRLWRRIIPQMLSAVKFVLRSFQMNVNIGCNWDKKN